MVSQRLEQTHGVPAFTYVHTDNPGGRPHRPTPAPPGHSSRPRCSPSPPGSARLPGHRLPGRPGGDPGSARGEGGWGGRPPRSVPDPGPGVTLGPARARSPGGGPGSRAGAGHGTGVPRGRFPVSPGTGRSSRFGYATPHRQLEQNLDRELFFFFFFSLVAK